MPGEAERISEPQITYLGRLYKEKSVDILVRAALMGLKGIVVASDGCGIINSRPKITCL